MKDVKDLPMFLFQLLNIINTVPLEYYFFLPFLLIGAALIVLPLTLTFSAVATIVMTILGAFSVLAYFYYLTWADSFPQVPGKFEVININAPETFPKSPAQITRDEINCKNTTFVLDKLGRRVLLRGVNLSGATKVPTTPDGNTFVPGSLDLINGSKGVSFVGRPCPLEEADFHLARLRSWGLTFLRFLITWEAVEHEGPGIYDEEYLDYLEKFLTKCHEYGISVFIDPHQDVWSRFTGGDGAPSWTLEKVGFDLELMEVAGGCFTQQKEQSSYKRMHWATNYFRLVNATMWTLFFAGNDFAPNFKIEGETAQDYLQGKYCEMMKKVAEKVKHLPNVIGFDTLNEPSVGFLEQNMIDISTRLSPWQAILSGLGETIEVNYFKSLLEYGGRKKLNTKKVCVWKNGPKSCVWFQAGLYSMDKSGKNFTLNKGKEKYFMLKPGTDVEIELQNDYAVPFFLKVRDAVQSIIPDAVVFYEPILSLTKALEAEKTDISVEQAGDTNFIYAKHYYNGLVLMAQKFRKYVHVNPNLGIFGLRFNLTANTKPFDKVDAKYFQTIINEATVGEGLCPTLIGETGIPFNMKPSPWKDPKNFDFKQCDLAMNQTLDALDIAILSYTLWNYTPDNSNAHGDLWNIEDLSIFSPDQIADKNDLHSGGRCLSVVVRPYAFRTAGIPKKMEFEAYDVKKPFYFEFAHDPDLSTNETLIFLPSYQYPEKELNVKVSDGEYEIDWDNQTLIFKHTASKKKHWIKVCKK
eukprot:snap_masked-scaffold_21-processed-gene-5.91-mRNA-1 protein AED:0.01 eAED:0.01 QI:0/0/0/1/1/1/2/0/749